jgi:hypothetical protein
MGERDALTLSTTVISAQAGIHGGAGSLFLQERSTNNV